MRKGGSYECHVCLTDIDPSCFVHPAIPPSAGAVQLKADKFKGPDGWHAGLGMQDAIHVRALSDIEAPKLGCLIPLSKDVDRLGFLHAWSLAKQQQAHADALKSFAERARCMRVPVSFVFMALV